MRKYLVALTLTAALPTLALAGDEGDCPHMAHGHKAHFEVPHGLKGLELTKEQLKAIGEAFEGQQESQKEITERYLGKLSVQDKAALQKDLDDSREAREKAVLQILTPEQRKTYEGKQERAKAAHAEWAEFQQWKAEKAKTTSAAPAPTAPTADKAAPEKK